MKYVNLWIASGLISYVAFWNMDFPKHTEDIYIYIYSPDAESIEWRCSTVSCIKYYDKNTSSFDLLGKPLGEWGVEEFISV